MQRFGYSLFALCMGVLAAAPGCGSNHGCEEYARTLCTRRTECAPFYSTQYGANFDACVTNQTRRCELDTKSPDTAWSQDAAMVCARAYATASCDDVLSGRPNDCRAKGKRPVGATCGDGYQCDSSTCVRSSSATLCGTCSTLPKVGESCATSGLCDYGLQCLPSGMCAPLRTLGEACDDDTLCLPTLACMVGTCQKPSLGATCNAGGDCNLDFQLQYCSSLSLTCEKFPFSVSKIGESCGSGQDAIVGCTVDAYCKTMGSAQFGVCTALPGENQPCATDRNFCAAPYACISGTCQVFDRSTCK